MSHNLASKLFALSALFVFLSGMLFAAPTFAPMNNTGAVGFNGTDHWFSDWDDTLRVSVNITSDDSAAQDPITNVTLIIANTSGTVFGTFAMSPIAPNDTSNATHANGTAIWNITLNLSAAIDQFNRTGITTPQAWLVQVNATDNETTNATYLGKIVSDGPATRIILVHNLGDMQGPPADAVINGVNVSTCVREGSESTNISRITNFEATNFVMAMEMNGSADCAAMFGMSQAAPWGNTFKSAGKINFTSVNLSTQAQAQAVMSAMGNAIQITIAPPRSYQPSRIYINSSAVSALNTTANITFYYLPFTSVPNITYDSGGDNGVSVVENITWYDASNFTTFMNLTLQIGNFSGYNLTDEVAPLIQIHTPTNASNYTDALINFTVNGTGTDVNNITVLVVNSSGSTMHTSYYIYNGTHATTNSSGCTNSSAGYETMNCVLENVTLPAVAGNYTLTVTAYDYGGSAGNSATGNSSFMNNTAPTLSANISYTNASANHAIVVTATATDLNGGSDINYSTITTNDSTNFNCTFTSNTTSGNSFTVVYACSNSTAFNASKYLLINITLNDTYNNTLTFSQLNVTLPNHAPVVSASTYFPSILYNYTNATCIASATDADTQDPITYNYRWFINETSIYNDTASSTANSTMYYVGNLTVGANITCEVTANDSITTTLGANLTQTVQNSSSANISLNAGNVTTAEVRINYTDVAGNQVFNLTLASGTNVSTPAGYIAGTLAVTNYTASAGDFLEANATAFSALIMKLGPAGTTFSPSITVTFNYSSLSTAAQAQIEAALISNNMWIKKCNETGGGCTNLGPSAYNTASNLINVSIDSFSTIGLYDATPTPRATVTTTTGSTTGGGSFQMPSTPTTQSCTEDWSCTEWSACENERSIRTCTDAKACGTTYAKPDEVKACGTATDKAEPPVVTPPVPGTESGDVGGDTSTGTTGKTGTGATGTTQTPSATPQGGGDIFSTLATIVVIVVVIVAIGAGAYFLLGSGKKRKGL